MLMKLESFLLAGESTTLEFKASFTNVQGGLVLQ